MDKNQIFIKSGTEYKKMTKELLTASNLAELIGDRHKMDGIKPNLVSPSDPSEGGTTHPEIVAGILEYLKENGFQNMMILEGSWVGDRTADAFEVCGYRSLCENYDVKFYDTQKGKSYVKDCSGLELKICESVKKVDFLINVPVMKGHCQTKITCALKNMKGLIPNTEKRHFHAMGLHKPIAHLNTGIHQDFIVVDNICGDLDFEDGGNPVVMIKYFNRCFCYAHIDFIFDILIRHGVVHLVYCDVIVELDSGLFPLRQFEGCGRQRCQQWLFFPKK